MRYDLDEKRLMSRNDGNRLASGRPVTVQMFQDGCIKDIIPPLGTIYT